MEADCSLVGGETAILPDFYQPGDYDMAGFCVGVVERDHIINGRHVQAGDVVLGLASSGLHSNGYSLVRKVVFERAGLKVTRPRAGTGRHRRRGAADADAHLRPKPIRRRAATLPGEEARGPRPGEHHRRRAAGQRAPHPAAGQARVRVKRGSWPVPPVFGWLQRLGRRRRGGDVPRLQHGHRLRGDLRPSFADSIVAQLAEGVPAWHIGEVRDGEVGVEIA